MKTKVPLIISLALNVVLILILVRPTARPEKPEMATTTTSPTGQVSSANKPGQSASVPIIHTNVVTRQFSWREVESPDYREYIANLRSIGCPEETIRDIIIADVKKLYEEKRKQVRGTPRKFEYWKPGNPLAGMLGDPETMKAMRALQEEKNGVLRALGIEPDPMDQMMALAGGNPMDTMFDFLPEEKRAQVTKAMTEFQSKIMESAQDKGFDPETMGNVQHDMEAAIKAVLTPQEFLDYQLRFSTTATMMRMQLDGFDPTESEFLDVFKLRAAFDDKYSPLSAGNLTEAGQQERNEAQEQLNQSIKQLLGEQRFADYQRSQDFRYQQLYRVVSRANLDPAVANQVYDMKGIAEEQAARVRSDSSLTQEQRAAALQAVRQETEQSMHEAMGDEAWEQYNRPANTYWLRGLAPAPAPAESQ